MGLPLAPLQFFFFFNLRVFLILIFKGKQIKKKYYIYIYIYIFFRSGCSWEHLEHNVALPLSGNEAWRGQHSVVVAAGLLADQWAV